MSLPDARTVEAVDLERVAAWIADRRSDLVEDLVALVDQETPSDDPGLLAKGAAFVEDWVTARLGQPDTRRLHESDTHGSVLVLDYPGPAAVAWSASGTTTPSSTRAPSPSGRLRSMTTG